MLDTRVVKGGVWGEPRLHGLKHTGNEQSWFSRQKTAERKNRRRVFSSSCLLVWWLPNSVVALSSSLENENLLHAQDDLLEAVVLACNGNSRKSLTRCRKVIKVTCLYFWPRRREKCVAISWSRFRHVWKSELNIHYVFLLLLWFRNVAITTTLVSKSKLLWTRLPQTNILCHTWAFVWRSLLIFKPC